MLLKLGENFVCFLISSVSELDLNVSKLDSCLDPQGFSKIEGHESGNENRVSKDCQLTFERHCSSSSSPTNVVFDAS